MRKSLQIFFLFFLITFISCIDLEENDIPEMEDILLANGALDNINTSPGDKKVSILLNNGLTLNAKIHFPQNIQNAPLILGLHWEGDADTYEAYADCHAIAGFSDTNAIIVAPSIAGGIWWEARTETLILDLIQNIINTWPVNKDRVAITGYSNGATAVWLYAAAHPDIFSAAIPIAGSYSQDAAFQIPLYVIHSLEDEAIPYENVMNVVNTSIGRGSEIKFVLVDGLFHIDGCSYTTHLQDAGDWLVDVVWQ